MIKIFVKKTGELSASEQSRAAHKLLKAALSEHFGVAEEVLHIHKNEKGAPYIVGIEGVFVSISHTKGLVACAFSDQPVGVDAQVLKTRRKSVEKRVFTVDEIKYIECSDEPDKTFFAFWTIKESYLKAIGTGFADNAKEIEIQSLYPEVVTNKSQYGFSFAEKYSCMIAVCGYCKDIANNLIII